LMFFMYMRRSGMMNKPGLPGRSAFFCFWKRHTDMSDVPYSYASAYDGMDYPYSKVGYPLLRAAIGPRTADDYAHSWGIPV
jgi:hypothetical protein